MLQTQAEKKLFIGAYVNFIGFNAPGWNHNQRYAALVTEITEDIKNGYPMLTLMVTNEKGLGFYEKVEFGTAQGNWCWPQYHTYE